MLKFLVLFPHLEGRKSYIYNLAIISDSQINHTDRAFLQ